MQAEKIDSMVKRTAEWGFDFVLTFLYHVEMMPRPRFDFHSGDVRSSSSEAIGEQPCF